MTGKRILLVEDNPDDAELTMLAFRKNNVHDVQLVRDGAEAIEWLFGPGGAATAGGPAIVLLDLNLPKVDGFGVLQRIRNDERTRFLPVVILTSSTEGVDLANAYRLGANSYIRKPVDFGELLKAALQIGLYWLSLNQSLPPRWRQRSEMLQETASGLNA
jgi:two-component system, response regulator